MTNEWQPPRTRTRRRLGAVLVACLSVAGIVAFATGSPFGRAATSPTTNEHRKPPPSPNAASLTPTQVLDDLPQGPAPAVPYLEDGDLHIDGITISTTANQIVAAGNTVLVGRSDEQSARWWIVEGSEATPVPELDGVFAPRLSPRGDLLVWTSYPDRRTTRLTAWQPATRTEIDHVDLDAPYVACCGGGQEIEIYGIDARNQVYWASGHGYRMWRPGSGPAPRPLSGIDAMLEIAPVGPVRQGGALGRVDPAGHWTKRLDLPTDQGMVWSADGRLAAYSGDDTGRVLVKQPPTDLWVLDPFSGTQTRLDLPSGLRGGVIGFESDGAVLVDAFAAPRRHYVLRCRTGDGGCEKTLPAGRTTWVFPERASF